MTYRNRRLWNPPRSSAAMLSGPTRVATDADQAGPRRPVGFTANLDDIRPEPAPVPDHEDGDAPKPETRRRRFRLSRRSSSR